MMLSEKIYSLDNGLITTINDETIHYFGGYFHVRMAVRVIVHLSESMFTSHDAHKDAHQHFGSTIRFERLLEKMAVPTQELQTVKQQLIQSFEINLLPYLNRSDFGTSFVNSQYKLILKKRASRYQR